MNIVHSGRHEIYSRMIDKLISLQEEEHTASMSVPALPSQLDMIAEAQGTPQGSGLHLQVDDKTPLLLTPN